jgi:ankyrin repeat protein
MVESGLPLDPVQEDGDTPLHHIDALSSAEFIATLKNMYPAAGRRTSDGRTPLELLLIDLISEDSGADISGLKELVRVHDTTASTTVPEVETMWPFLCEILSSKMDCESDEPFCGNCCEAASVVCEFLLDMGCLREYEAANSTSGVPMFVSSIQEKDDIGWPLLPESIPVLLRVINSSRLWDTVKDDRSIVILLMDALEAGWEQIALRLLENGISAHARVDDLSPLETACSSEMACSDTVFQSVLDHADLARLNELQPGGDQCAAIHQLGAKKVQDASWKLSRLLEKGVDVNQKTGKHGIPALVWHLQHNSLETATMLLDAGADPNLPDKNGFSSLMVALEHGYYSFLEEAKQRQGSKLNWRQKFTFQPTGLSLKGTNAIHLAALGNGIERLQLLINEGLGDMINDTTEEGHNCLHFAARVGNAEAIRLLCSIGHISMVNQKTKLGESPLALAAKSHHLQAAQALLDAGADHAPDIYGVTPLLLAVHREDQEMVKLLEASQKRSNRDKIFEDRHKTLGMMIVLENGIRQDNMHVCKSVHDMGCALDEPMPSCGACSPLLEALRQERIEIASWILEMGVNILEPMCESCSPDCCNAVDFVASTPKLNKLLPNLLTVYLTQGGAPFLEQTSPIFFACTTGNTEALSIIFDHISENPELYRY